MFISGGIVAHPKVFRVGDICDLYPQLSPIDALNQAAQDELITEDERKDLAEFASKMSPASPEPKPRYELKKLRELICPWEGKPFKDLTNEEIDANVDAYDPELKQQALAYLEMRGFK